jgi:peptidoglycan/LPS O-acetylase OafA/YrhL
LIEGLRGYLALWVLVCHVLWASAYEATDFSIVGQLIREGRYAVQIFLILSGFVIFFLLDHQKESYGQFIVRRFFRLYPLFLLMFVIAIPVSRVLLWDHVNATQFFAPDRAAGLSARIDSWWDNIHWHSFLHLTMLHGLVPESILPGAPGAFLEPAWSISLEWQFYLIAPVAFALACSARPSRRLLLCAAVAGIFLARPFWPKVQFGAALPFHLEYLFLGGASYFLYRHCGDKKLSDITFPVACCVAFFIARAGPRSLNLGPICLWIVFLGLLLENRSSLSARFLSPLFNSPWAQYLGSISYSIYLSHFLVLACAQYVLLNVAPGFTQPQHFWALLVLTFTGTLLVSAFLYAYVELPGMRLGRRLAADLGVRQRTRARFRRQEMARPAPPPPAV